MSLPSRERRKQTNCDDKRRWRKATDRSGADEGELPPQLNCSGIAQTQRVCVSKPRVGSLRATLGCLGCKDRFNSNGVASLSQSTRQFQVRNPEGSPFRFVGEALYFP